MDDQNTLIDWTQVATLKEDMGEDGFADVIEIFLEEMDELLADISIGTNSAPVFHAIKGSASNLGFIQVVGLAAEMEANGASAEQIATLRARYTSSRTAFEKEIS